MSTFEVENAMDIPTKGKCFAIYGGRKHLQKFSRNIIVFLEFILACIAYHVTPPIGTNMPHWEWEAQSMV